MGWKNWPDWLKGGIFGLGILTIIIGLIFLGISSTPDDHDVALTSLIFLEILLPFKFLNSILDLVFNAILYFIIGAIIYKYQNMKKKI